METRYFGSRADLAVLIGILCCVVTQSWAQDVCCPWPEFPDYGDGRHGTVVISTNMQLSGDRYYQDLTVQAGVTLDTCGHTIRVCGTLINRGTITDSCSGGLGGPGGEYGHGHDPWEDNTPPECELMPLCTPGDPGLPGLPDPDVPQAGTGGRGGGGGGGGAGAWYDVPPNDTDGGNGGDGGQGGRGGGYVHIWAYRLENKSTGLIHADGHAGGSGGAAGATGGCPCENTQCGPEHCEWGTLPVKDIAGGGGGGGGGGAGGNGGTVAIHFAELIDEGTIRANGGAGGGGGGGASGCWVEHGVALGGHREGCEGGLPNGGDGGDGRHQAGGYSGSGSAGGSGAPGNPGTVLVSEDRPYCKIDGNCYWEGEVNPTQPCQVCQPDVSMTEWTCLPDGWPTDDGLWCNGDETCQGCASVSGVPPCVPCDCDDTLDECITEYTIGGAVFSDCDDPIGSGQVGVQVCVSCMNGFNDCAESGMWGVWEITGVPCHPGWGNTCTVTVSDPGRQWCYVGGLCPPPTCETSVEISIDEQHDVQNQNIKFLSHCLPYDMNGDGDLTLPGDVPCFANCVYFQDCACCEDWCVCAGDCSQDGFLSVVGDVGCYVDCLYWGDCPLLGGRNSSLGGDAGRGFLVGGAVFEDLANPIGSGKSGIPVKLEQVGGSFEEVVVTGAYGIWYVTDVPDGEYIVLPLGSDYCYHYVLPGPEIDGPPPITIVVDAEHQAEIQSILFLASPAPPPCAGDLNCDGLVDYGDIDAFVAALTCIGGDPSCWPPPDMPNIPECCPWLNGDCNDDGNVTYADIDPFVARIGSTCP